MNQIPEKYKIITKDETNGFDYRNENFPYYKRPTEEQVTKTIIKKHERLIIINKKYGITISDVEKIKACILKKNYSIIYNDNEAIVEFLWNFPLQYETLTYKECDA